MGAPITARPLALIIVDGGAGCRKRLHRTALGCDRTSVLIEHRWNLRVPVQTRVSIRLGWFRSTMGTTRDISFEGMYVETPAAQQLGNNTVQVAIPIRTHARPTAIELPGVVVRTTDSGVGLLLTDYDDEIFQRLAALLAPALDQRR